MTSWQGEWCENDGDVSNKSTGYHDPSRWRILSWREEGRVASEWPVQWMGTFLEGTFLEGTFLQGRYTLPPSHCIRSLDQNSHLPVCSLTLPLRSLEAGGNWRNMKRVECFSMFSLTFLTRQLTHYQTTYLFDFNRQIDWCKLTRLMYHWYHL